MNIPTKIKEILKEARWSQEEFSRRLNVSFKTLNEWVTGKTEPRKRNVEAINQFYLDIVGRKDVTHELLQEMENKALATHIEINELLENEEVLKKATLYLTYHTNTIEGSTMTIEDVQRVLDDERTVILDKTVREQLEARNHRSAFNYLLSQLKHHRKNFVWSEDLIKEIHLRLMNSIIESAGVYRSHSVRILGSHIPLANYVSVPKKMENLVKFMNSPYENLIERLAVTHSTFEQIHPFGDGNGRTGRLIMFAQAIHGGIIPPLVIRERKKAYYKYLEIAQLKDEYNLLRLFIAESIFFTKDLLL